MRFFFGIVLEWTTWFLRLIISEDLFFLLTYDEFNLAKKSNFDIFVLVHPFFEVLFVLNLFR